VGAKNIKIALAEKDLAIDRNVLHNLSVPVIGRKIDLVVIVIVGYVVSGNEGVDAMIMVGHDRVDGSILIFDGNLKGLDIGLAGSALGSDDINAKISGHLLLTSIDRLRQNVVGAFLYPMVFEVVGVGLNREEEVGIIVFFGNVRKIFGFGFNLRFRGADRLCCYDGACLGGDFGFAAVARCKAWQSKKEYHKKR
jgi:hypothetical protein